MNGTSLAGRIVVGSDGSPGAGHALRWAAARARAHGRGLTVLRVHHLTLPMPTYVGIEVGLAQHADWTQDDRSRTEAHLEQDVSRLQGEFPDLDITGEVREGHPASTLAEVAGEAELLVLGATGVSAVARALLGGTVSQVIEHAHGAVAVVPEQDGVPDGPVVAALDDSDLLPAVLDRSIREARATSGRLVAVHGWHLPETVLPMLDEDQVGQGIQRWLDQATGAADYADLSVERVARQGRPTEMLVDLSGSASVLVMGSRGRGGFTGLLLGSVSRGVIRRASCPVIVVRTGPETATN